MVQDRNADRIDKKTGTGRKKGRRLVPLTGNRQANGM